ncbi:MAG: TMEM175 family protein [Ignavibacteria bacterium]
MQQLTDDTFLPKQRLETLCDGIFAITMTLIILDLKTPENLPSKVPAEELPKILYDLLPSLEAYAISFIILGIFWLRHQIGFRFVSSVNRPLIFVNILFLLFIGFVPFTVGIMMRYPALALSFRLYIINLILISLLLTFQWIFISRSDNVAAVEIPKALKKNFLILSFVPILIFGMCFIASYFNLRFAFLMIYLDPLFYAIYRRVLKRKKIM